MNVKVASRITIDSPPSEVFKYLTDLRYVYLWNPKIIHVSSRDSLKLGSEYKTISKVLGVDFEAENIVTKFEKDIEVRFENCTGLVRYVASYKLSKDGSKTVLLCDTVVSVDVKPFSLTAPVLKLLAKRELHSDLEDLRFAVENRLPPVKV